jgi:hypothetical protein
MAILQPLHDLVVERFDDQQVHANERCLFLVGRRDRVPK